MLAVGVKECRVVEMGVVFGKQTVPNAEQKPLQDGPDVCVDEK